MLEEEGTHSKDRDEDTLSNTKINELILKILPVSLEVNLVTLGIKQAEEQSSRLLLELEKPWQLADRKNYGIKELLIN